jgi:hypothetical protein
VNSFAMRSNHEKDPLQWEGDIDRSVSEYNDWYLREAPILWARARDAAINEAAQAMEALEDFRDVSVERLKADPATLSVVRMALSPKMARDRFVEFVGVKKNLVTTMERKGCLPKRSVDVDANLQRICEFAAPLLDPQLFPWIADDRPPAPKERRDALLVLGDRRASAVYEPELRNAQEVRQKLLMREFLESHGFIESFEPAFEMPPGTFGFGRNVPIPQPRARKARNLPVDCVVAPKDKRLPLACVEMKSAGDFTNVNKRRKEEAEKHDALHRSYGDRVVFVLQLFGYFDAGYLDFEAAAGIDWAWDHRLVDLAAYFGIQG